MKTKKITLFLLILSIAIPTIFSSSNWVSGQNSLSEFFSEPDSGAVPPNQHINNNPASETEHSQNLNYNFTSVNDTKEWMRISGIWNYTIDGLHGGSKQDINRSNGIVLSPQNASDPIVIDTSFKVQESENATSRYVSIVYGYNDPLNYRQAGISIDGNTVTVFDNVITNGIVSQEVPNVLTDVEWQPDRIYDMSLSLMDKKHEVSINGKNFTFANPPEGKNGNLGLGYGGIENVYFNNFSIHNEKNLDEDQLSRSTQVSDSINIMLEDKSLPAGDFIHLYDSIPYKIVDGHIAAKLPCNDDDSPEVDVLVGHAPNLQPVELEFIGQSSIPGEICLYHMDIASDEATPITDLVIQNNSSEDIEFPETSNIIVNVNEVSTL